MTNTLEDQLSKCQDDLDSYKQLVNIYQLLSSSIQDDPFKQTDLLLSDKYFGDKASLLETTIYSYLECHAKLIDLNVLQHNSIDIYLPSTDDLTDLFSYLSNLNEDDLNSITTEYFKFVIFSHHFKIKQLVSSLYPLINTRFMLSSIMICRALFENVAVLNSYYELYSTLILQQNETPSYQGESHGKIKKGDLSNSFKKIISSFKERYQADRWHNSILYCLLSQRFIDGGKVDLSLYNECDHNWNAVFANHNQLTFINKDFTFEGISNDISFLSNKFNEAINWYSIICEFVHPNSGSHRTVIFENVYGMFNDAGDAFIPMHISQEVARKFDKYRGKHELRMKYKLCSVSSFESTRNYSFIVESTYVSLVNLLTISKDIMLKTAEIIT